MKISKRTLIFAFVGLLTFALTFATGVLVTRLTTFQSSCIRVSPWQVLLSFENQDLQGLDEEQKRKVEAAVQAITGKRNENILSRFEPALFRLMSNTEGAKRYVLVEEAPLVVIPGHTTLRVHVFDEAGRLLNVQEFNAGNRTSVTSMRIRKTHLTNYQFLIIEAEYWLVGHPFAQYYALKGDRMEFVHLSKYGVGE